MTDKLTHRDKARVREIVSWWLAMTPPDARARQLYTYARRAVGVRLHIDRAVQYHIEHRMVPRIHSRTRLIYG